MKVIGLIPSPKKGGKGKKTSKNDLEMENTLNQREDELDKDNEEPEAPVDDKE